MDFLMHNFEKAGFHISILFKKRGLCMEANYPLCCSLSDEGMGNRLAEIKTYSVKQRRICKAFCVLKVQTMGLQIPG